ncbi:MAG: dNTP triphosphohydrolase [Myxococcales bacterium]|nr:MAG: dNTP triphosphohydrolase [Myxococcales bacterium]
MPARSLAAYAVHASRGRRWPVSPDPLRGEFRRDIGRILYSKAFRRLAFKTQVFSPEEGDHYRNRLTHTLETAQIARVVAGHLSLNEELAEAIALAHDLGHPPFGHQGEHVLDRLMAAHGGFDHNLQNLRVVALIEVKSDDHPGLNLTYETLFGVAKSEAARTFLIGACGLLPGDFIASVEARVADLADDLAYTAHDFDDYARYHGLSLDAMHALPLGMIRRCLPRHASSERIASSACVRNLVATLVTDLIRTSQANLAAIGGENAPRAAAREALGLSPEIEAEFRELAGFLAEHMYFDANLKAETLRGAQALETLFEAERARRRLDPSDREGHLALCDYLSGMTDRYALRLAGVENGGHPA